MSLDTILTIVGLLVAVYAIAPRHRRLELPLFLNTLDIGCLVLAIGLIISFHSADCFSEYLTSHLYLTPKKATLAVVLVTSAFIYFRVTRFTLRAQHVFQFSELATQLLADGRYAELALLYERHWHGMKRIYDGNLTGRNLKEAIETTELQTAAQRYFRANEECSSDTHTLPERVIRRFLRTGIARQPVMKNALQSLARLLPSRRREQDKLQWLFERSFTSEEFVSYIALVKPYFGLTLFSLDRFLRERFVEMYFAALLKNRNSVLYFEIEHNQNTSPNSDIMLCSYELHENNRILHHLFSDAKVAEGLQVWRGVGNRIERALKELRYSPSKDPYLRPFKEFDGDDLWSMELWVGIRFFDIMVSAALWQGIEWHMWLYNLPHFVEDMAINIAKARGTEDPTVQRESIYEYLISETFNVLSAWALTMIELPSTNPHKAFKRDGRRHSNRNIPLCAIDAYGQSLLHVLPNPRICPTTKSAALQQALMMYRRFSEKGLVEFAGFVLKSVKSPYAMGKNPAYDLALRHCADDLDDYNYSLCPQTRKIFNDFVSVITTTQ